jgi:hypothetical protein
VMIRWTAVMLGVAIGIILALRRDTFRRDR